METEVGRRRRCVCCECESECLDDAGRCSGGPNATWSGGVSSAFLGFNFGLSGWMSGDEREREREGEGER